MSDAIWGTTDTELDESVIREAVKGELEELEAVLEKYDLSLYSLAQYVSTDSEEHLTVDLDEDEDSDRVMEEVRSAYEDLTEAFYKTSMIKLGMFAACAEVVSGEDRAYWTVENLYTVNPDLEGYLSDMSPIDVVQEG